MRNYSIYLIFVLGCTGCGDDRIGTGPDCAELSCAELTCDTQGCLCWATLPLCSQVGCAEVALCDRAGMCSCTVTDEPILCLRNGDPATSEACAR